MRSDTYRNRKEEECLRGTVVPEEKDRWIDEAEGEGPRGALAPEQGESWIDESEREGPRGDLVPEQRESWIEDGERECSRGAAAPGFGKMRGQRKGGAGRRRVLLFIMAFLVLVIGISLYHIVPSLLEYHAGSRAYSETAEEAGMGGAPEPAEVSIQWEALRRINPDIRAWLYLPDSVINYPVVRAEGNEHYLHYLFNGDWNPKGTLFVDCNIEKPFGDFLTIIYGHRMRDKSMFWCLGDYRDDPEYWAGHRFFYLFTPKKRYKLEIFAQETIPSDSPRYRCGPWAEEEKESYLEEVLAASELQTDVEVSASDRIVMLSTCTYEFEEARLVVYGKLMPLEEEK